MALKNVKAFGGNFDLSISRAGDKLQVQVLANDKVIQSSTIGEGESAMVNVAKK